MNRTTRLTLTLCGLLLWTQGMAATSPLLLTRAADAVAFDYCAWTFDRRPDGATSQPVAPLPAAPEENASVSALVDAGVALARAAASKHGCRRTFSRGQRTFELFYQDAARRLSREAHHDTSRDPAIAAIQASLAALWIADQASRLAWIQLKSAKAGAGLWAARLALANSKLVDAESTAALQAMLVTHDWIDRARFGHQTSKHAWLLVQHADDHPEFQADVLGRMTAYLETGGVRTQDWAYLFDRVAVNRGEKQRFGTQPTWECGPNGLELAPLEDPENVAKRRAEMNLPSLEESLAAMSATTCGTGESAR